MVKETKSVDHREWLEELGLCSEGDETGTALVH